MRKIAVYEVHLHQEANDLNAMVQVISLSETDAEAMVHRTFFQPGSWKIMHTKKVRDFKPNLKKS